MIINKHLNTISIYRGKDVFTNEWRYGDLIHNKGINPPECKESLRDRIMINGYEINKDTISKFTGLYDKDNNKIFYGDLLKYKYNSTKYAYIGEVIWDNNQQCTLLKGKTIQNNIEHIIYYYELLEKEKKEVKIMGNIYDKIDNNDSFVKCIGNYLIKNDSDTWSYRFFYPEDPGCRLFEVDKTKKRVLCYDSITREFINEISYQDFKENFGNKIFYNILYYNIKFKNT